MPKRFDLQKKKAILKDYTDGMKTTTIALKYGCSESYPTVLAGRSGVPFRLPKEFRDRMSEAAITRRFKRKPNALPR